MERVCEAGEVLTANPRTPRDDVERWAANSIVGRSRAVLVARRRQAVAVVACMWPGRGRKKMRSAAASPQRCDMRHTTNTCTCTRPTYYVASSRLSVAVRVLWCCGRAGLAGHEPSSPPFLPVPSLAYPTDRKIRHEAITGT